MHPAASPRQDRGVVVIPRASLDPPAFRTAAIPRNPWRPTGVFCAALCPGRDLATWALPLSSEAGGFDRAPRHCWNCSKRRDPCGSTPQEDRAVRGRALRAATGRTTPGRGRSGVVSRGVRIRRSGLGSGRPGMGCSIEGSGPHRPRWSYRSLGCGAARRDATGRKPCAAAGMGIGRSCDGVAGTLRCMERVPGGGDRVRN